MIDPSFLKIFFPWILWKGPKNDSNVYLTFDDGPHPEYTKQVLEILGQHQARASFFLQGEKVLLFPGIVEQIKKQEHTIGNHGFSHESLFLQRKSWILEEIEKTDEAIEKITGQKPVFFRPPYGRFDPGFRKIVQKLNHRLVIWSLLSYDFRESDPRKITRTIQTHLHPGAIIVCHDGHRNTSVMLKALPEILKKIRDSGYHCQSLYSILEIQK
jgi:peptidoglycan/xylan/chitin deacetylase (PgdA/CDA1 family)